MVATEVRNLAQRSANVAREIKGLIGDSVGKVETGSKLVADVGATMEEVVRSVKQVTGIMAEIASASQKQSSGIEQVNQAVTQMDRVTQQNAALVEQAATAAESMEDQAVGLSKTVSVFRMVAGGATAGPVAACGSKARALARVAGGTGASRAANQGPAKKLAASGTAHDAPEEF